jgi:putative peptidoglycan lipid II flippase
MPRLELGSPVVKRAATLLVPLTMGLGVYQVNVMLARLFASYLDEGAQSYLYYGQRLVEIPQGMFALALASASLPRLSSLRAQGDAAGLRTTFVTGLRQALFVALPASALLVALAEPIVTVLFGRGAFERQSVIETSSSLLWQGAGVAFIALVRVVVPVFYAHQDTRSPVWASLANLAAFSALAYFLREPLGHVGIAVAISAAGLVQFAVLWGLLRARHPEVLPLAADRATLARSCVRLVVASIAAGLAGFGVGQLGEWSAGGNDLRNIAVLIAASLAAGVSYVGVCALLRAPELGEIVAALRRRRR